MRNTKRRLPSSAGAAQSSGGEPSGQAGAPSVVRSEEELQIAKRRGPGRTVRMKKEVVTDYVTKTVPVRREKLRLVEQPIPEEGADRAAATDEPELTLHEEEPVIQTRVVPKEKVRLRTDSVTSEAEVSDEVRKEQVEVTDDRETSTHEQR